MYTTKEEAIEAIESGKGFFENEFNLFRDDKEIALIVVRNNSRALRYVSDRLRDDRDFILDAAKQNGWVLRYVSERLQDDKEIALIAVRQDGWVLRYVSERMQDDRDVVLEAVRNDGLALGGASERLKEDKEFLYEIKDKLLELDGFEEVKENLARYEHEDSLLQKMQENNAINPDKQQSIKITRKKI